MKVREWPKVTVATKTEHRMSMLAGRAPPGRMIGTSLATIGNYLITTHQAGYVRQPLRRTKSVCTAASEQMVGHLQDGSNM